MCVYIYMDLYTCVCVLCLRKSERRLDDTLLVQAMCVFFLTPAWDCNQLDD